MGLTFLLSAGMGVVLGVIHARLALQPLLTSPLQMSPKQLVFRFLLRILALSVILVLLTTVGVPVVVLLPCLVAGFVTQSAVILRRVAS